MLYLNKRKITGLLLVALVLFISMSTPFQDFASIPTEIRMFEGNGSQLRLSFPVNAQVVSSDHHVVAVSGEASPSSQTGTYQLQGMKQGTAEVKLQIGQVPVKRMKVNVLPEIKVIPGGQSIGVKLNSLGVVVVGHHFIQTDEGKVSPGEVANLKVGDIILKMNDIELKNLEQIGEIVEESGKNGEEISLEVLRGQEKLQMKIKPALDAKENRHRLGVYIKNSAAGVGTLTFYHPESKAYGALGHVISDMDTQKPIVVGDGTIIYSSVSSIERGESGQPGEKITHFMNEKDILGNITRNTPFGIFGHMYKQPGNALMDEAIPIALNEEVEKGPAEIFTVVEGEKVERFDIEIVDVINQKYPATKGLVLKVTDPVLLEKTGGIVQGMSGSPIIQNGKIVGAVTHVFINDPTSGYGCFIEWMLQDAGVEIHPNRETDKEEAA